MFGRSYISVVSLSLVLILVSLGSLYFSIFNGVPFWRITHSLDEQHSLGVGEVLSKIWLILPIENQFIHLLAWAQAWRQHGECYGDCCTDIVEAVITAVTC